MAKAQKKKTAVTADMYDVIVSPVVTEKSQAGAEHNKITFKVAEWACKEQVKAAVEAVFDTKVTKVNVVRVKGKTKRFRGVPGQRKETKKAIVTLAEGKTIDVAAL